MWRGKKNPAFSHLPTTLTDCPLIVTNTMVSLCVLSACPACPVQFRRTPTTSISIPNPQTHSNHKDAKYAKAIFPTNLRPPTRSPAFRPSYSSPSLNPPSSRPLRLRGSICGPQHHHLCVLSACPVAPEDGTGVFAVNTAFSEASFKYDILFLGGEISLDVNRPPTK